MSWMRPVVTMAATLRRLAPVGPVKDGQFQDGMAAYQAGDYVTAMKDWRRLAKQGDATAQNNLGALYAQGRGVLRDYTRAAKWFRLAAKHGYAAAQDNLGTLYRDGHGVPQDYTRAAHWYRLAAAQGDVNAQFNLGLLYDQGQGVPQDYTERLFENTLNFGNLL